jgi:hypothetical protein
VFEIPLPEWTEAFVDAEADGREVDLFAALLGLVPYVRPEWACIGSAHVLAPAEVPGEARYVPAWAAWPVLCEACAVRYGAR